MGTDGVGWAPSWGRRWSLGSAKLDSDLCSTIDALGNIGPAPSSLSLSSAEVAQPQQTSWLQVSVDQLCFSL